MKITKEMLDEAIEKINSVREYAQVSMTSAMRYELSEILTAMIDPENLTYMIHINGEGYSIKNLSEVIRIIKEHANPGDGISVSIQDEDFDDVGAALMVHMKNDVFLSNATNDSSAFGAGIELAKTLNEIVAKTAKGHRMSELAWKILAIFVEHTQKTYKGEWGRGYIAAWTMGAFLDGDAATIQAVHVKIQPQTKEELALKELVDLGLVEEMPDLGERFRLVVKG